MTLPIVIAKDVITALPDMSQGCTPFQDTKRKCNEEEADTLKELCIRLFGNKVDLCEADLSGVNLRGADLSGANLREADLGVANLYGDYLGDIESRKKGADGLGEE